MLDVITTFEHDDGERLLDSTRRAVPRLATRARARARAHHRVLRQRRGGCPGTAMRPGHIARTACRTGRRRPPRRDAASRRSGALQTETIPPLTEPRSRTSSTIAASPAWCSREPPPRCASAQTAIAAPGRGVPGDRAARRVRDNRPTERADLHLPTSSTSPAASSAARTTGSQAPRPAPPAPHRPSNAGGRWLDGSCRVGGRTLRAEPRRPRCSPQSGRGLPRVELWSSATQTVFGEGPRRRTAHARRRAAWRPRGPLGPYLRRPCRPRSGLRARDGGHRAGIGLPDQRGEAFPLEGERQAAPARAAGAIAHRRVPAVAAGRVGEAHPSRAGADGSSRSPVASGPRLQRHALPWAPGIAAPTVCLPWLSRYIPPRSCAGPTKNGVRAWTPSQPTCVSLPR